MLAIASSVPDKGWQKTSKKSANICGYRARKRNDATCLWHASDPPKHPLKVWPVSNVSRRFKAFHSSPALSLTFCCTIRSVARYLDKLKSTPNKRIFHECIHSKSDKVTSAQILVPKLKLSIMCSAYIIHMFGTFKFKSCFCLATSFMCSFIHLLSSGTAQPQPQAHDQVHWLTQETSN